MTTQQQMTKYWSRLNRRPVILALIIIGITALPFLVGNLANSSLALSAAVSKRVVETQIRDLHPFTHFASIPASSDPKRIKFEKVKATRVFTKEKSTIDSGYCKDLPFRDPGGSMYCPYTEDESPAPAYEVIYSFKGQPLASDEYGSRYFTFQVYFRPEELPLALRTALSTGKVKRAELATYFNVATSRAPVRAAVIDEANSSFCDGNYVDGNWIQKDPACKDKVSYKTVSRPSDYITVQVDPVSPGPQQTALPAGGDHSADLSARESGR
ncbi:MAG: hypothetical protein JWQ87_1386 [Candidatus Sulfotelmatobacter sp.]|nr:hypothetical protein [Candidatus Sulfotelmatobacter sp.]